MKETITTLVWLVEVLVVAVVAINKEATPEVPLEAMDLIITTGKNIPLVTQFQLSISPITHLAVTRGFDS